MARHQRHCAANVVRQHARSNERRCRTVLVVWAENVELNRAMRARLCGAVHRLALLRLGAAFGSWARLAEAQRLRRLHLDSLLQRVSPHPVMCSVDIFLRKQEAGTCVTGHLWLSRLARFP